MQVAVVHPSTYSIIGNCIRTLVAMAHSSHKLIMGKVEIDDFFSS